MSCGIGGKHSSLVIINYIPLSNIKVGTQPMSPTTSILGLYLPTPIHVFNAYGKDGPYVRFNPF